MSKYERVPGGEKTEKTGVKWAREELQACLDIYGECRESIHERNPRIQELAKFLGRSVRSVENQLLMFRAIERSEEGEKYSRDRMNKLCLKLWKEKKINNSMSKDETGSTKSSANKEEPRRSVSNKKYPEAFFNWTASTQGGVRRLFHNKSGRPTGKQIRTPILDRIESLADQIAKGQITCKALLLVGGPGNGKTDSIENFLIQLDKKMGLKDQLLNAFKKEFSAESKRKVNITVPLSGGNSPVKISSILLVQDASQGDDTKSRSHELFLEDLENHLGNPNKDLFICCINRGILDNARHTAKRDNAHKQSVKFLDDLTKAITPSSDLISPWPIKNSNGDVYAWPMDVDSLLDGNPSTYNKIMDLALEPDSWENGYDDESICPFAANRSLLNNKTIQEALSSLLSNYQVAFGKRWTFREIFGALSYLMIGPEENFESNKIFNSPKEYSKKRQHKINSGDPALMVEASGNLLDCLYYHKLFPNFPDFREINIECQSCFPNTVNRATALMSYLSKRKIGKGNVLEKTFENGFRELLDPALVDSKTWEIKDINDVSTMLDIERKFSVNVQTGFDLVKSEIPKIEQIFFDQLIEAEKILEPNSGHMNKLTAHKALKCCRSIRRLAVIIFKRSYGVRKGIGRESKLIKTFIETVEDDKKLIRLKGKIEAIIKNNYQLNVPLTTTIGQRLSNESIPKFNCPSPVTKHAIIPKGIDYPSWAIAFLETADGKVKIPINYSLYKAITMREEGILEPCLPRDLMGGLDNMLMSLGGLAVRDENSLHDPNSSIDFGDDRGKISVIDLKH